MDKHPNEPLLNIRLALDCIRCHLTDIEAELSRLSLVGVDISALMSDDVEK